MTANAESAVSQGALRAIHNEEPVDNPILQCLQIKKIESQQERYRLVLSDIHNFIQSMLGTHLNSWATEGKLQKGGFLKIKAFQTNFVKGKKIMIIMDCEVVEGLGIREKIGMPGPLENPSDTGGAHQVKQEEAKPQPGSISSNNFYGEKPQQPAAQKALPTRSNANGPGTASYGNIYPIEALSPYAHRWTIKVRCTSKGEIKTWHKPSSEGKLFSANFLDESGEIRATGFNESVDQLYNVIQEGQVYYISTPCRVTIAKKQFSNLSNDYELSFERDTVVEKAEDPDSVPKVQYNFTNIGDLEKVQKDGTVDTIGILESVGEVQEITSKNTGKPYQKRELNLVDDTHFSVRLTIWGNTAQSFDAAPESVVAFKGLKVGDFGGRSLSLLSSGSVAVDPDIDEAYKLKGWYDAQGRTDKYTSHAETMGSSGAATRQQNYKTISQVREEQLGMGEEASYFALKAIVVFVKSDTGFSYPGCRTTEPQKCNKKVTEVDPGQWRCEKCDRTWDRPEYRYIMSVNVQDHTGQLWLSCFDEVGRQLIGASADEMQELRENEDPKFQERVQDANCNLWVFRVRAKMDTYNDQQRVRYQVSYANPLNYAAESAKLAETLKQYQMDENNGLFVT